MGKLTKMTNFNLILRNRYFCYHLEQNFLLVKEGSKLKVFFEATAHVSHVLLVY